MKQPKLTEDFDLFFYLNIMDKYLHTWFRCIFNKIHSLFSSVVEHWSRKPGVAGSNPAGGNIFQLSKKNSRSRQGSNLRSQRELDFKSNALTTRPQLPHLCLSPLHIFFPHQKHSEIENVMAAKNIFGDAGDRTPGLSHAKRTLYH